MSNLYDRHAILALFKDLHKYNTDSLESSAVITQALTINERLKEINLTLERIAEFLDPDYGK